MDGLGDRLFLKLCLLIWVAIYMIRIDTKYVFDSRGRNHQYLKNISASGLLPIFYKCPSNYLVPRPRTANRGKLSNWRAPRLGSGQQG